MTDQFVGVDVQGLAELRGKMERFMPICKAFICEEVADYLVLSFQEQPSPNHSITRRKAYPEVGGWFGMVDPIKKTTKQQRWFFWALHSGRLQLPYRRTQDMRKAWKKIGKGENVMVVNETTAAVFTMDDERQARFSKLVGWKTTGDIIKARHTQIERRAAIGLKKGLKKAGFKTT